MGDYGNYQETTETEESDHDCLDAEEAFETPYMKWEKQGLQNPYRSQRLRVLCLTWNMNGKLLEELDELLRPEVNHDLYVISTQECSRSIAKNLIYKSKEKWVAAI